MPDDDQVHLTVPAEPDLASVVIAAVGAVARSAGVGDRGTASARSEAERGFAEVLERGTGDVVTLTARAGRHEYWFELHRDGHTYTAHKTAGG